MDYNVQSNIKKTVFSDIKEITNTNVAWNRFNGKTVLITVQEDLSVIILSSHFSQEMTFITITSSSLRL